MLYAAIAQKPIRTRHSIEQGLLLYLRLVAGFQVAKAAVARLIELKVCAKIVGAVLPSNHPSIPETFSVPEIQRYNIFCLAFRGL